MIDGSDPGYAVMFWGSIGGIALVLIRDAVTRLRRKRTGVNGQASPLILAGTAFIKCGLCGEQAPCDYKGHVYMTRHMQTTHLGRNRVHRSAFR